MAGEPISLPKGYKRLGDFPLDEDSLFYSIAEMEAYILGGSSYGGQVLSLVNKTENTVETYKILPDKSYKLTNSNVQEIRTIYVNSSVSGANNGTTWEDAFTDLQLALKEAKPGNEIWVAQGTYYPTDSTDRTVRFELPEGIEIYGGFAGSEILRESRDHTTNETIISGNIGDQEDSSVNSYVLIRAENLNEVLIDGFTFTEANNEDSNEETGACVRSLNVKRFTLKNCILKDSVSKYAGGLYVNGGHVELINCEFTNLDANSYHDVCRLKLCTFFVNNCYFHDNNPKDNSGVSSISLGGSGSISGVVANSVFENEKGGSHSAIYVYSSTTGGTLVFHNNKFKNCYAQSGTLHINGSVIIYCTNSVFDSCGCPGDAPLTITGVKKAFIANNTFLNTTESSGADIYIHSNVAEAAIYNCLLTGSDKVSRIWTYCSNCTIKNCKYQAPLYEQATANKENNIQGTTELDTRYSPSQSGNSDVISNGAIEFWEEMKKSLSGILNIEDTDFHGNPRVIGESIDIGAVETIPAKSKKINPEIYTPWDGTEKVILLNNEHTEKYVIDSTTTALTFNLSVPDSSIKLKKTIVIDNKTTNDVEISAITFIGSAWKFTSGGKPSSMNANVTSILEVTVLGDDFVLANWININ